MYLGALSGHERVCPSSPRTSTEQVRFAQRLCFEQQWDFCGQARAPQGTSLQLQNKDCGMLLYTSGISEECQSLRSVTGHNSGPTRFAGLTWSWFTPVKSSSFWEGFMEQLVRGKVSIPAPFSQVGDVSSPLHLSFITGSGDAVPHYP